MIYYSQAGDGSFIGKKKVLSIAIFVLALAEYVGDNRLRDFQIKKYPKN
jgi:hypothetical protein